ncbi:hypothetical protein Tco_1538224 [Tanacetum coccineum]
MAEFPQVDSGLAVPVFKQGDDPIDAINKMMSFLSIAVTSYFPSTNNQLRNSSNPRQQETIHDGRVTIQPLQGRQNSYATGTLETRANTSGTRGNYSGQQRVVKCFNCQGEAYQADDLDAYDSDYEEISTAKVVLMANLSSCGSDVLSEKRISHKKTKNQAKSDKTGHGMEKWADYANLGNFIYKRKKGEKENEKKKDVEGLFFQHPVLLPYFYPATLHQPLDKAFPLTPHGHSAKLAIQGHFRSKG